VMESIDNGFLARRFSGNESITVSNATKDKREIFDS
jgi:hypothetical protein